MKHTQYQQLTRNTIMGLTLSHISVILALSGLIIASIGTVIGILAYIDVKSIQRSTHSIQYMPVDDAIDKENEAYLSTIQENDWATSPDVLKEQESLYKDELEKKMPDFVSTDEDMEILSV